MQNDAASARLRLHLQYPVLSSSPPSCSVKNTTSPLVYFPDSPYSLFPLLPALLLHLPVHCPVTVLDPAPDLISSFPLFYVYVSNPDVPR